MNARDPSRRATAVLVVAAAVAIAAAALTSRLSVKSDLSYLLPESTPSVLQLRALEKRARIAATVMLGVESPDVAARARAGAALLRRIHALDASALGIGGVTSDDALFRRYTWDNRFLFADLADLTSARDALRNRMMKANPLYVSLDEPDDAGANTGAEKGTGGDRLDALRKKLDEAQDKADHPKALVSTDGRLQLIVVRATFNGGDLDSGSRLVAALQRQIDATLAETGPGVTVGMAGDVVRGLAEQRGLVAGMTIATLLTVAAVLAALLLYFRSLAGVLALGWSLTVGALVAFAFTELTIGHLNIASAFLSSIVVGNGINFGIIFLGRYFEERREGHPAERSLQIARTGTMRATAAAALAAGTAYLSLAATPFRGFRDFGIIGGMGMACCWLSAYTVLPAALAVAERRGWIRVRPEPRAIGWFERMLPKRPRPVLVAAVILFAAAALGAGRYLTHHPLETDLRNLASTNAELDRSAALMDKFDRAFGHGISGGFALAVNRREEVAPLVRRLRAADEGKPERDRLFSRITTLDDRLPADQPEKLEVLDDLRRLVDRQLRHPDTLTDADRKALRESRPPERLRALGDADVPLELAWPYVERDGTRGRIVLANTGLGIDSWKTHDLQRFAAAVRGLGLGPDVLVGGSAFVFSDMLQAMERDGPRATLIAALGAVVVVVALLGPSLAAFATLFCGAFGTLALVALAGLFRLKVNFLDFVALPITIGIGIDYSVNIISRARTEPDTPQGRVESARTASAVALCSYTTVVGYGSLWFSANKGIQSFGYAAMLGEATCLSAALLIAPALARLIGSPPSRRSSASDGPGRGARAWPRFAQARRQRGGGEAEQQAGRDVGHPVVPQVDRRQP
jgi:predicted RND superfamily exporter protein